MKRRYVLSFAAIAVFLGLCTLLNAQEVKPAKIPCGMLVLTKPSSGRIGLSGQMSLFFPNGQRPIPGSAVAKMLHFLFKPYKTRDFVCQYQHTTRRLSIPAYHQAKILHFTRAQGFEHEPVKMSSDGTTPSGKGLKAYFADKKIELVETQDGTLFDDDLSQYDGFIFATTGNLLGDGPRGKPMTEKGLRNVITAVQGGKGLVGFHNATDTFCGIKADPESNVTIDNGNDIFTKLIGARFSGHGAEQIATVTTVKPAGNFPFLKDIDEITVYEEWYAMKSFNKDIHVLMVQKTEGMSGGDYNRPPYPTTWIRMEGKGRVGYTSFGHHNAYFEKPENVKRIGDLVEWSLGRFDSDTTPNIDKAAPEGELPPRQPRQPRQPQAAPTESNSGTI